MSLPIVGAKKKSPNRPTTHAELDMGRMMQIAGELGELLEEHEAEALTPALVEEIAEELGVRESHVYVAAATMSEIPCHAEAPVQLSLCVGNCQKWGAVELLERVLDVHGRQRASSGDEDGGFDVVVKSCLDRCVDAPVVLIRTPEGMAGLAPASLGKLDEALRELQGS